MGRTLPICRSPRFVHRLQSRWPSAALRAVPVDRRLSTTKSPPDRAAAMAPSTPRPHPQWSPRWPRPPPRPRSAAVRDRARPRPPLRHHRHRRTAAATEPTTTATTWSAPRLPRSSIATLLPPWQQQQRPLSSSCKYPHCSTSFNICIYFYTLENIFHHIFSNNKLTNLF